MDTRLHGVFICGFFEIEMENALNYRHVKSLEHIKLLGGDATPRCHIVIQTGVNKRIGQEDASIPRDQPGTQYIRCKQLEGSSSFGYSEFSSGLIIVNRTGLF